MRDIKVVGYGNASEATITLIENYLNEKLDRVTVLNVDGAREVLQAENAMLRAKVAALEAAE